VALLDFDVHHGNGTQACVARVAPTQVTYGVTTPLCEGSLTFPSFHPWLDENDSEHIMFARQAASPCNSPAFTSCPEAQGQAPKKAWQA